MNKPVRKSKWRHVIQEAESRRVPLSVVIREHTTDPRIYRRALRQMTRVRLGQRAVQVVACVVEPEEKKSDLSI